MARVAVEAARLASAWGGRPEVAFVAGLVHDALKGVPPETARRILAARGWEGAGDPALHPDEILHGPLLAAVLEDLGLGDADLLGAVRHHTTGRPGMTPTEAAVLVADQIEPGRAGPEADALRREVLGAPADAAVRAVLRAKSRRLEAEGRAVVPGARAAIEAYR